MRDASDGSRGGGDGDRDGKSAETGEAVADALGEQDVGAPADGCQPGEGETGGVDVAVPGLGEQCDPDQGEAGPDECSAAVAAYGCDGQRAEELDCDGGAEWDALPS